MIRVGTVPLARYYAQEIEQFFRSTVTVYPFDPIRGNVWVARHEGYDTLTVEPPGGGQYELAVRIRRSSPVKEYPLDGGRPRDQWEGYVADENGYLRGRNTEGH